MIPTGRPGGDPREDRPEGGVRGTVTRPARSAGDARQGRCRCEPRFREEALVLAADGCPGRGDLATAPACRATAVGALTAREVREVRTATPERERCYAAGTVALLVAAGRFAGAVGAHDGGLARLARRDPVAAAARATARSGPAAALAAETGLAVVAEGVGGDPYEVAAVRPRPGGQSR